MTYIPEVGDVVDVTLSNVKVTGVRREYGGQRVRFDSGAIKTDDYLYYSDYPQARSVEISLRDRPSKYVEGDMIERREPGNGTSSVAVKSRDGKWTVVYSELRSDGKAAVNTGINESIALVGWVRDIRKGGVSK